MGRCRYYDIIPPIQANSLYAKSKTTSYLRKLFRQLSLTKRRMRKLLASLQVTVATPVGNRVVGKRERLVSSRVGIGSRRKLTTKRGDNSWREQLLEETLAR